MPSSVTGSYSGDAAEFAKSLAGEPWLILAAAIAIYIVLGVLYESFIHPLTILSTLPSAGVGALLALMLFGYDLSVIALIGIVLLMGIVKKNAILMIDFAHRGRAPRRACRRRNRSCKAALLRFRPIMMTTLAALFGALPLALESGTGSELRNPLGITIVGGLLLSQLLTLYTTPVIYLYMERLRARLTGSRGAAPADALQPAADQRRENAHELLLPLHPPADRHHAAGDRPVPGRRRGLRLSAGRQPAERRISRPSASRANRPGADPNIMAATVAAPLERRLGEISGVTELTSVSSLGNSRIVVQFDLSRSIEGAARDVQAALNAALSDLPGDMPTLPTLPQSQSGGGADPDPGADLQDHAAERDLRRRRQRDRAAAQPGRRRRRRHRRRLRAAGDPRARRSGAHRRHGREHGGSAHGDRQFQRGRPARHLRRRQARRHHRHQRPAAQRRATTIRWWSRPSTAR